MADNDNSNVIYAPFITRLDIPVERVLESALKAGLSEVIIIGFNDDGSEYFGSSTPDGGSVLWHLERAKLKLLTIHERLDE